MNLSTMEKPSRPRAQPASAAEISPAGSREATVRRLHVLYREAAKSKAEDSPTYGCVEWYLYPQAK
jgi:hypothetical protein